MISFRRTQAQGYKGYEAVSERFRESGDISKRALKDLSHQTLQAIRENFDVVGVCMLGYTGMPDEKDPALQAIVEMGMAL